MNSLLSETGGEETPRLLRTFEEQAAERVEAALPHPLFELSNVGWKVGEREILADVSLNVRLGRILGLIGPNGSGKSTLLRILANQLAPARGAVRLLGRDLATYGGREFARLVAFLPQFTPPAEGMTVRELVSLGRFPWHGALGRVSRADRRKVEDALADANLLSLADRLVDTLSGGERQRAWLGLTLAQDARCLLLDEPTSALDVAHQVEVLDLVRRLSRERGLAAVVVLHDVNMAARVCDELVALRDGRVWAKGTPEAIMNAPVLEGIYGIPMNVLRAAGTVIAHVA